MAGYPYYQPMVTNPYQQSQMQLYQDRLAQLQNNYQQTMPFGQMQPVQAMTQMPMIQGQMVDGIDTVKAKDVDMSGNPVYYPKTDGTEIYRKQLQSDGKSQIFVYRLVEQKNEQSQSNQEQNQIDIVSMFNQLRQDVCSEISGIKEMFPTFVSGTNDSKQQSGGKQR